MLLASGEVLHSPVKQIADLQDLYQTVQCNLAVLESATFKPVKKVTFHAQMGEKMGPLEDHADTPMLHRNVYPLTAVKEYFPIKRDEALIRMMQPGNKAHQGRFAAP